jgi:fermentation-respiration switch protein FrsA (DUF1100 family)
LASFPLLLFSSLFGVRWIEHALTFHPEPYDPKQYSYVPQGGKDVWLVSEGNVRLHGLFIDSINKPAQATIIYLHGNGGNLSHVGWLGEKLAHLGFDVFLFDYRGYGRSEGTITGEADLYADADAAYDYVVNHLGVSPKQVVLYGQSLGTTATVDLASRKQCGGIILESGLSSAKSLASTMVPWLPGWLHHLARNRFESAKKLAGVECPVLITHGDPDRTIPTSHAHELFAAANEPKRLLILPGADHNVHGFGGDKYFDDLADFVREAVAKASGI